MMLIVIGIFITLLISLLILAHHIKLEIEFDNIIRSHLNQIEGERENLVSPPKELDEKNL